MMTGQLDHMEIITTATTIGEVEEEVRKEEIVGLQEAATEVEEGVVVEVEITEGVEVTGAAAADTKRVHLAIEAK